MTAPTQPVSPAVDWGTPSAGSPAASPLARWLRVRSPRVGQALSFHVAVLLGAHPQTPGTQAGGGGARWLHGPRPEAQHQAAGRVLWGQGPMWTMSTAC